MMIGVRGDIANGYTGNDHLISPSARAAVMDAVAGIQFRRAADALRAAEMAFRASCDYRTTTARIIITLRNAFGDEIKIG